MGNRSMSNALSSFQERMNEVTELMNLLTPENADLSTFKEQISRDNAICRAAIVLLCSHLQGFLEDLVSDLISAYNCLANSPQLLPRELVVHQVVGELGKLSNTDIFKQFESLCEFVNHPLISAEPCKLSMKASFITEKFGNPGTKNIESLFKSVGVRDVWGKLFEIEKNRLLRDSLDSLVARRNEIAHGNYSANATKADLDRYVVNAKKLAEIFNSIISSSIELSLGISDCWQEVESFFLRPEPKSA